MAYITNPHDFQLKLMREMIDRERRLKQKVKNQNNNNMNDYRNAYDLPQSPSSRDYGYQQKISLLTEENQNLKQKYGELLQRVSKLIEAYQILEAENKTLKTKQKKKESFDKFLSGLLDGINNIIKKIIIWFNT